MLTRAEEFRLAACKSTVNSDIAEHGVTSCTSNLNLGTVRWLIEKLIETGEELERVTKNHTKLQEIPRNPLGAKTNKGMVIIAVWEKDKYECIFCDVPSLTVEEATEHAHKHIKIID